MINIILLPFSKPCFEVFILENIQVSGFHLDFFEGGW
jgi:hypothetical protein